MNCTCIFVSQAYELFLLSILKENGDTRWMHFFWSNAQLNRSSNFDLTILRSWIWGSEKQFSGGNVNSWKKLASETIVRSPPSLFACSRMSHVTTKGTDNLSLVKGRIENMARGVRGWANIDVLLLISGRETKVIGESSPQTRRNCSKNF